MSEASEKASNNALVASHYNAIPTVNLEARKRSYVRSGDRVLDIACGKGGDLRKYVTGKVSEVVGLDLAENSIKEAQKRYSELRNPKLFARFYTCDCFTEDISKVIEPSDYIADLASIQFALHYAFESEVKVRTLLKNVSTHLKEGGVFVGTTTNAMYLKKKLESVPGLEFGNSVYNVRFEKKESDGIYGQKYWFFLEDAISDCHEYLVHFPRLVEVAQDYGLDLLFVRGFHEFYQENSSNHYFRDLLFLMKVIGHDGSGPSSDEWEAAGKDQNTTKLKRGKSKEQAFVGAKNHLLKLSPESVVWLEEEEV
ncbi:mRNA cap guanine-N7 methyltransferase [Smittium mucronatum]|uniref:mRNA cap guanine-N(7) methyltransferase n=1 Tax=Smittium mucronatum TaxID=133383 RepID=A0A1R0H7M1_9FUNG|nr:mRNA cap guanine-N7 methyltransferase [Smittium mucronatum]